MKRIIRTTLFTSILCLLLCVVITPIARAQSGGIGGRPANPEQGNERTKSIFVKKLGPGQSATDTVEVTNNSNENKNVLVYSVDSAPSSGGAFACAQLADPQKGVGTWVTIANPDITLAPNEKKLVSFTITVPENAEAGEQNGCIVLQEKKDPTFQGGIGLSFRTAIRLAVLVPGEIKKELTVNGLLVTSEGDKVIVSPQVTNTGNVSLDSSVMTKISSALGLKVSEQTNTFPVLRDQATQWSFEFKKPFWGGFYRTSFTLTYDQSKDGYIGSATSSEPKVVQGPTKWFFSEPEPLALGIELGVIIILAVLGTAYYKKRSHKKNVHTKWSSYTVKSQEQLQDIAKQHSISWKKLAASNKLKAPYHLKAGQVIKVPSPGATKRKK